MRRRGDRILAPHVPAAWSAVENQQRLTHLELANDGSDWLDNIPLRAMTLLWPAGWLEFGSLGVEVNKRSLERAKTPHR